VTPHFVALAEEYLSLRRSFGFALVTQERLVLDFARWAERSGDQAPLTVDLVVAWARSSGRGPGNAARRLTAVRGFVRHCAGRDPATEVPPAGLLGPATRRKLPHVYSEAELTDLLRAAARLRPFDGLRPHTYVTLFSLLASTGLRVSEGRRLACQDVDLDRGLLTIRESKFRKSRLVPLHASALVPLRGYAARRDRSRSVPRSQFFFRAESSPYLTLNAVETTFWRLRRDLGWTAEGRARLPRIHDLRYTFVARRLLRWYEEGIDVHRKVAVLATYLGHVEVSGTYWYFTAMPELLAVAGQRFECFAEGGQESAS
jgi:integrase